MPRLTKRQKEAGKGKPKTAGGRVGGKPGAKSGGFKVGPSHAPRNAYLGKAQKKKAELIAAAKVKKEYAKVLAKEGMQSVRVGGAVTARTERPSASTGKGGGKRAPPAREDSSDDDGGSDGNDTTRPASRAGRTRASPSPSASASDDDADSDVDSSDDEDEAARFAARMRQAAREADEARAGGGDRPRGVQAKKGKDKDKRRDGDAGATRHGRAGPAPNERPKKRPRPAPSSDDAAPRAPRALSPEPTVTPAQGRLRDLKREAFGKRHAARPDGRGRGQPNMGARMDVLLEKIRRTK